jgi:hypothetical protein
MKKSSEMINNFELKGGEDMDIFSQTNRDESVHSYSLHNLVGTEQRKGQSLNLRKIKATEGEQSSDSIDSEHYFEDNIKLSKYRILATIDKLDHTMNADYEDYYTKIVKSKVDVIKFSLSIYDDHSYENLKQSVDKMTEIMLRNNVKIPIMISMQYRIMRLRIEKGIILKKKDKLLIKISNFKVIPSDSRIHSLEDKSNVYFINNEDYFYSKNAELGDKFIVDFGKGLFTITKIIYKNGNVLEMSQQDIDSELEKGNRIYLNNKLFCNEDNPNDTCKDLLDMVEQFYGGKEIETVNDLEKDFEIDYMEVIVNFDCQLPANRLVQLWKKSKNVD